MQIDRLVRRRRRGISMVPLIDVVFILLLFFMLSTSLIRAREIPVDFPTPDAEASVQQVRIIRLETEEGAFSYEGRAYPPADSEALRGLVAEDYLADWADGRPPVGREDEPVVYLSAHAAEAFAAWFSGQLPPAPGGGRWLARLPFEPEWEYAARGGLEGQPYPRGSGPPAGHLEAPAAGLLPAGQSPPNGYGLRDMLGSVWEWTADWYSPTRYLLDRDFTTDYQTNVRFMIGTRRVVRGGSFTSDPRVVKVHTRGSQPAAWCTPVLGFRLVLVEP